MDSGSPTFNTGPVLIRPTLQQGGGKTEKYVTPVRARPRGWLFRVVSTGAPPGS